MEAPDRARLERTIAASWLLEPAAFPVVRGKIQEAYFADGFARRLFEVSTTLSQMNVEASATNIAASGKLSEDETVQLAEVLTLADGTNLRMLLLRLCEIHAAGCLNSGLQAAARTEDVFQALEIARIAVTAGEGVIQRAAHKAKPERINEVLARWHREATGATARFPSGYELLDSLLNGGFSPAGLSFAGGYAGEGKTTLALAIAIHLARTGVNVMFLEGEMPEDELHDRAARMTKGAGTRGRLDWLEEYEALPLDFLLLADRTPSRLLGAAERAILDGARFVVVDYLQAFSQIERETDKHYLAIKNLSAQLRALVLRHAERGVMLHIMALSNLNRSEAGSGRPGLSSLYGSSGLAHDCTEAIMVYSENSETARFEEMRTGERPVTLEVVKARNERRGPLPFLFMGALQRFREVDIPDR